MNKVAAHPDSACEFDDNNDGTVTMTLWRSDGDHRRPLDELGF